MLYFLLFVYKGMLDIYLLTNYIQIRAKVKYFVLNLGANKDTANSRPSFYKWRESDRYIYIR